MITKVKPPQADEWTREVSLYICVVCSEELGFKPKKFCDSCGTIAGREQRKKENEVITQRLNQLRENKEWIYA